MADFPPLGHVALSVRDVNVSRPWYTKLFGRDPIVDHDAGAFLEIVWTIGGGTIFAIHQHKNPSSSERFDELRPGLDHVSFHVANRGDLDTWEKKLGELGIEHGGILDTPGGSGLSFRDPDNTALEFFALPG